MKYAIGIDVGATNIRLGICTFDGQIIKVIKQKTCLMKTPDDLVNQIIDMYNQIEASSYELMGIGIGVPGPVSQKDGHVHVLSNLGLKNFNLKKMLAKKIKLPIVVGNDAKVAALAEAKVGAGKGFHVMQYITISTGIGGGLAIDGNLYYSTLGFSQEIGNMNLILNKGRIANPNMNKGCFEAQCSGTAIVDLANQKDLQINHAGELFILANQGNEIAIKIRKQWIKNTALALSNLANVLEPDIFVFGGGVMLSKEYFIDDLYRQFNKHIFPMLRKKIPFAIAHFDQDAGIIGASFLVQ